MGSHLLRRPPTRRSHSRPPRRTRLVQVDGRIVDLNCELSPGDRVTVSGQPVTLPEPRICPWAAQRPAWGGGGWGVVQRDAISAGICSFVQEGSCTRRIGTHRPRVLGLGLVKAFRFENAQKNPNVGCVSAPRCCKWWSRARVFGCGKGTWQKFGNGGQKQQFIFCREPPHTDPSTDRAGRMNAGPNWTATKN